MQSCSKRNELPLNAKLCVRFLFLIHAEYSKVSSFFFCADSDLRRFLIEPSLTCGECLTCAEMSCADFVAPKCRKSAAISREAMDLVTHVLLAVLYFLICFNKTVQLPRVTFRCLRSSLCC